MPMLPDALEELDALLAALPQGEDFAPLLSEVDGLLAGTLVAPEPIAEAAWLPLLWAGEGVPADYAPPPRLIELVRARRSDIAGALLLGEMRYLPIYDYDTDDSAMWEIWIEGFGRAMALWSEDWSLALEAEDEELRAALSGLALLVAIARGMPAKRGEAAHLAANAANMIPYLVEVVYRRRRGLGRVASA